MKNFKKVLSLALAALMVIGGLVVAPVDAKAEGTYTKVTDVSTITSSGTEGKNFVVVAELGGKYYAMNAVSGNWVTATEITIVDGAITSTDVPVIKITGDVSAVNLATVTGDTICGQLDGNKIYTDASSYVADWTVSEVGTDEFQFFLVGSDSTPRYLAFSGGTNLKFRQYKETSINNTYDAALTLYEYTGNVDVPEDIELDANATPAQIVDAAYQAMKDGVDLLGTWTLTGVITEIGDAYTGGTDYKNASVTMQIGDMSDKLIGAYRLTVADTSDADALAELQTLAVGDTITVTGTLGYYGTTVQFTAGCILDELEKPEDAPENIELEADATAEEIVNAAYKAKEDGVQLLGTWALEGVITAIDTPFSSQYNNITVTIQVGDMSDKLIQCYRLTVADTTDTAALADLEALSVGDTITVEGTLSYYGEKVQYAAGTVLKEVEKGELPDTLPETAKPEEIVNAAYDAMNNNTPMIGEYKLTGIITSIDTEYSEQYGNITVTMVVDGMEDKPIQCYRLAGTGVENLKVGDTITVKGTFGNYNGKVQYNQGSTLEAYTAGEEIEEKGDMAMPVALILFAGCALVAVAFIGKRKMA